LKLLQNYLFWKEVTRKMIMINYWGGGWVGCVL